MAGDNIGEGYWVQNKEIESEVFKLHKGCGCVSFFDWNCEMKFEDIPIGEWFTFKGEQSRYLKLIPTIEDKYGNLFVAISDKGYSLCLEDTFNKEIELSNSKELISWLIQHAEGTEWLTHNAAENSACPYCNIEWWEDQHVHNEGCEYVTMMAKVRTNFGN